MTDEKMGRTIPIRLKNFTKGEASILPFSDFNPRYSAKLQNCHISPRGGVYRIPGYVKVNTTQVAETLISGFEFRKTDGTKIVLCAGGGKIYKVDTNNELTAIKTGLNTGAKVFFSAMNNICIMTNGVDAPMKYDGTTVAALGGTPPATAFKSHVHKGRVWLIERINKLMASHSALNNPEDYTSANNAGYIDFKFVLKEGDELLDIDTFVDLLIFYFRDHVAIYSGTNPTASGDFKMEQLVKGVGVKDSGTVKNLGKIQAFLHPSGVKDLKQAVNTGDLNAGDVSEVIDTTLRDEIKNATSFGAAHYSSLGWLMLLIGSKVWIYSYTWKAWGRMAGADVKGIFSTIDGEVYICGTGFLYKYGSGWTFAGNYSQMIWETAWIPLSRSGVTGYPKLAEIICYPQDITTVKVQSVYDMNMSMIENYTEFQTEGTHWNYIDDVADWDALNPIDEYLYEKVRLPLFGMGATKQFIFSNLSDKQVEILDVKMLVELGGF